MTKNQPAELKSSTLHEMNQPRKLVLASRSPRRHQLLRDAGLTFVAYTAETEEKLDLSLGLDNAIIEIAREKGSVVEKFVQAIPNALILSSDTLVILGQDVLGKPRDFAEATSFLERLSHSTHEVKTAVYFLDRLSGAGVGQVETSRVTFRKLSADEIKNYVASGEPMDKAGAYGIQGPGGNFIQNLDGNLDNVMGLSLSLVKKIISQNHWVLE